MIRIVLMASLIKTLSVIHKPKWCAGIFGVYVLLSSLIFVSNFPNAPTLLVILLVGVDTLIAQGFFFLVDRAEGSSAYWPLALWTIVFLGMVSPSGLILRALSPSMKGKTATQPIEILVPGSYHARNITSNTAGSWMAVSSNSDGLSAKKETVQLEPVPDPMMDNAGLSSAKRIKITNGASALFLVRGIDNLSEGRIETGTASIEGKERSQMDSLLPMKLLLGKEEFQLSIDSNNNMVVWNESHQQLLGDAGDWRSRPKVVAVGDIDNDEKIDLMVTTSNNQMEFVHMLFLSSQAKPKDFFGPAVIATAF